MNEALKEAEKAFSKNEVPVGAVCVLNNRIISKAHNLRERRRNPLYHAEMLALDKSSKKLSRWRLSEITLYVTLEPCYMCAGALILSRIKRVVFGASDPKSGVLSSKNNILKDKRINHRFEVTKGILKEECSKILKKFFSERRNKDKFVQEIFYSVKPAVEIK